MSLMTYDEILAALMDEEMPDDRLEKVAAYASGVTPSEEVQKAVERANDSPKQRIETFISAFAQSRPGRMARYNKILGSIESELLRRVGDGDMQEATVGELLRTFSLFMNTRKEDLNLLLKAAGSSSRGESVIDARTINLNYGGATESLPPGEREKVRQIVERFFQGAYEGNPPAHNQVVVSIVGDEDEDT